MLITGARLLAQVQEGTIPAITPTIAVLARMPDRFGGVRLCFNKQVRTDLVDEAVWNEVCQLLQDPTRREEQEYRHRFLAKDLSPEISGLRGQSRTTSTRNCRLIDSYAEGT